MEDTHSLKYAIQQGKTGKNKGLPNGLKELNKYSNGVQDGRFYLIGAESGAGKTTFTDYAFFYYPYFYCKQHNIPLKINYFSFEISLIDKKAKLLSWLLDYKYGIKLSTNYILGRTDEKITPEEEKKIEELLQKVEDVYKDITFIDELINPKGMYKKLMEYRREEEELQKKGIFVKTINIVDHLGLINTSKETPLLKNTIDEFSKYAVYFRNNFNWTFALIQQFNSDLITSYRKHITESTIAPQRADFGDSKYPYRDADVVIGLVNPVLYGINQSNGYSMKDCNDLYVDLYLMKNRYGKANVRIPMLLNPTGSFVELPKNPTREELQNIYNLSNQFNQIK